MEERQIKASLCNLIMHGLPEARDDKDKSLIEYGIFNQIMGFNGVKIIKNERISIKKNIDGYPHPIKIALENEVIKSTVLKNFRKIKKIDVLNI